MVAKNPFLCGEISALFSVSIAAFTFGILYSWSSPTIQYLTSTNLYGNVTLEEASYLPVISPITAIFASPIACILMDKIGRKTILLSMTIPHLLAWIIIIMATSVYHLYISRVVSGLADACVFTVLLTYVGEVTTPKVRGSWGNTPTVIIYFGQLMINAVGGYFDIKTTAYIFVSFPILFFFTFIMMPESPYYLLMQQRIDEARESLIKLRRTANVEIELQQLNMDVQRQISESGTWRDLFMNTVNRKAMLAGAFVRGAQQLSGIAAFNTYTHYLFEQAEGNLSRTTSVIIFGSLLTIMSLISSMILDKLGRRLSMLISCIGCTIVLAAESIYFYIKDFCEVDLSSVTWIPLAGMIIYVFVYSVGLGIVPTLITSELFSASIKAKGVCVANVIFFLYISIGTKLFQYTAHNLGMFAPFLIFSVSCLLSTVITYYVVPETRGRTLEEIQISLANKDIKEKVSKA